MNWKFWKKKPAPPESVPEPPVKSPPIAEKWDAKVETNTTEPQLVYSPDRPEKVVASDPKTGTTAEVTITAPEGVSITPPKVTVAQKSPVSKKPKKKSKKKKASKPKTT